jgi:hypothetical protein
MPFPNPAQNGIGIPVVPRPEAAFLTITHCRTPLLDSVVSVLPYWLSHCSIRFHFTPEAYATSAVVSIVMFSGRELERQLMISPSHFTIKAYSMTRR